MDSYDPESGQVYRETIVKRPRKPHKTWENKCTGSKPCNVLSHHCADSLTAMALRKLVCHADQLRPETLAALPTHMVHQIRTAIKREGCETLTVWKNFAESGHGDKTMRLAASTSHFYKPLVNFFLDLVSPSFSWMVDLTLVDVYCSRIDLRQLSSCSNLMSLEVRYTKPNGQEPFDDEVCHGLANRAISDNSLSKLSMMFVANARGITEQSFNHISQLRALDTFCVIGTSIADRENAQGWSLSRKYVVDCSISIVENKLTYALCPSPPFSAHVKEQNLRAEYQDFLPNASFAEVVQRCIWQRRSDMSLSDWNLPSIDVTFGHSPHRTRCELSRIKFFERDLASDSNKRKQLARHVSEISQSSRMAKEPLLKKRKLKPGRAVGLHEMLDGL